MIPEDARSGLQLRSTIRDDARLDVTLVRVPTPEPGPDDVVVRVEATPINPSDLGLLFGPADLGRVEYASDENGPVVRAPVPEAAMKAMRTRIGKSMPVGNEGAGTVVAAGSSAAAQALVGRRVAALGGAMYSQYRTVPVAQTLALPDDATAADGASSFINPLTALGFIETMRSEGHRALIHTAAASNLGQMLVKICAADGIGLVNVVRKPEQEALLRGLGATHVCDSEAPDFVVRLTDAVAAVGATLAFDATGGGDLANRLLFAMESALTRDSDEYLNYGSPVHKQVYIYGRLDLRPIELVRNFGFAWGLAGWLVFPTLARFGPERTETLKQRVARELKTTFASRYDRIIDLPTALTGAAIDVYNRRATGTKYLIAPHGADAAG